MFVTARLEVDIPSAKMDCHGDFDMIYRATQKNNNLINYMMVNRFKNTFDSLELRELQLHGMRFTWSSGTDEPTLTKIDHLFYTEQWELDHPNCYLQALSFSMSDHLPFTPYTYACSTPPKGFQI
jgi:hypothetical protein